MSCEENVDCGRRRLLVATSAVGGVAGLAVATPFVLSMEPSERAKAAGAPVEADISKLASGQLMIVEWRGKPVWILRRTPEMLESLKKTDDMVSDPHSDHPNQPDYAKNEARSIKPEYLVLIGICTHLGCSPNPEFEPGADSGISPDWPGGFLCPCHGSMFDLAGRVFKNKPAPDNLVVPPYRFIGDSKIVIGEDSSTKA